MAKTGVWIVGARGGLATTMIVGTLSAQRGLTSPAGLFTETDAASGLALPSLDDLFFGGHEVRRSTLWDSAIEIYRETGVLRHDHLLELRQDLEKVDEQIVPGTAFRSGPAVESFADDTFQETSALELGERVRSDIRDFRRRNDLDSVIVLNLASTEPPVADATPETIEEFEAELAKPVSSGASASDTERAPALRASSIYAWAALSEGCPLVNFTPSRGVFIPALRRLAEREGLPYMGDDAKTGETLVKSALAPMFRYRNLAVKSWQGYNILGDRDGEVLADSAHRESKIRSKDEVIPAILGYPVHTHVGIDYVPSLHDQKTAWNFIHFQGFLDVKMSLQFIWQGFDSILAAPVALDLVRFAELARRRGESGPMTHLSSYFKRPLDVPEHDLHYQIHALLDYVRKAGGRGEEHRPG